MIAVPEFASAADLRAHYAALHARLYSAPASEPAPRKRDILHVASVVSAEKSIATIKAEVAARHGIAVAVIDGERRSEKVVAARLEAIVAVYYARPGWTSGQIGRAFKRDRTTILFYLRKAGLR